MRCEVVAVGTELLLGQIVDTNSAWLGEQLALAGIDCHRHTAVGDNRERMLAAFREALDRSDAVIVTGGLGPTQDDITRDVLAELMGVGMERDEAIAAEIERRFSGRGRAMPANNLRQADVPVGAWTMAEMPGTAPGLVCPVGEPPDQKVVYAVPGVPREMHAMVEGTVLPDLRRRAGAEAVIRSRVLRTWGRSESGLAEVLADEIERLDAEGGPTLAFLASGMEGLKVRITAKGADEAEVAELLADEEARVREIVGPVVFGVDDQTMESVVLDELVAQGLTLATAESLTGGMVGTRLTEVPGSSRAFVGSVVAYDGDVKRDVLGVPDGPVVSEAAVVAMAEGVCPVLGADVSVAVTGVAGPDPQDGVEPGTVWMATNVDGDVEAVRIRFPFDRTLTRQFTVISVLDLLRQRLLARRS
ncbi:MAG: competence/damage-inducible protein A [Acidimicrobiaceae bacterium]|nr:competence/damage-inducible protein A [Acidimicrobiaceae bacterium]|tara:strand:- start:225 stop:1478 length:1254 start_codon:yes stop_codon:yes gene_type:complete